MAEWSKSVALKPGVSQRRFESGRRQTVAITACILLQGCLNLSTTSPMTTSDAEKDVKLNILFYQTSKGWLSKTERSKKLQYIVYAVLPWPKTPNLPRP